jgi:hypothetical protein
MPRSHECHRPYAARALMSLTLLVTCAAGGCQGTGSAEPQPSSSLMSAAYGQLLDCNGPAAPSPLPPYLYDIDGDDHRDTFVAMRCPGNSHDQLEVFTGTAAKDRPERFSGAAQHPLIHRDLEVDLGHGCLMFARGTVLVGVGSKNGNLSAVPVTWIGRWDKATRRVQMSRQEPPTQTIPCNTVG